MATKYFIGTAKQKRTVCQHFVNTYYGGTWPVMSQDDVLMEFGPDTCIKVLYEDKYNLVYIAIDSCIEVVFALKKLEMSAQSIEL